WSAGNGSTLLDADIAWKIDPGFPHASEYLVQPTAAAINPVVSMNGDTVDTFNAVSVALKAAAAGTSSPSGIHINKIIHQTADRWPTSGTYTLQVPTTGNLLVANVSFDSAGITSITDSDGGTWNQIQAGNTSVLLWYSANRTPDPNLTV